ncbi:MAG: conjugal transfer protein TrbL, partial [Helicobacter sp.]|nr:conjugal transfer protein TrbL [Helicobacter sp.]
QISTWINYFIKETQTGAEVLGTGIFYVIASAVLSIMIIATKTFAEKIANVSMESAMGGVMSNALNPAGRLAGKALGYGAGQGANLASPLASMAGNYVTGVAKDIGAGAKLMGSGGYSFAKKMYEAMRNGA